MEQIMLLNAVHATERKLSSVHIADTELAVLVMGQGIFNIQKKTQKKDLKRAIGKRCFLSD